MHLKGRRRKAERKWLVQVRCLIEGGRLRPAALAPEQATGAGLRQDPAAEALSPEEALLWRVVCTWLQARTPLLASFKGRVYMLGSLWESHLRFDRVSRLLARRMRPPPGEAPQPPAVGQWHRCAMYHPAVTRLAVQSKTPTYVNPKRRQCARAS